MTHEGDRGRRVLLGVRGLTAEGDRDRVLEALRALPGVLQVRAGDVGADVGQIEVRYDDEVATAMDLIRAVRSLGYLAGME
ncbi:MAG: heavy-metal-associated domain-containing protein [Trueperaceae bacterium]